MGGDAVPVGSPSPIFLFNREFSEGKAVIPGAGIIIIIYVNPERPHSK
jgi:hypothetical protein